MKELSISLDRLVRSLYDRKGRREHGLCVCEGRRCCSELLAARPDLIKFGLVAEGGDVTEFPGIEFHSVPSKRFAKLASTMNSQGVILVAEEPRHCCQGLVAAARPFAVLLDRIADPGNLGTILRTLRAAGLPTVWVTEGTVDPYSEKVIRAAMAAQFSLRIERRPTLRAAANDLLSLGYVRFYRTEPAGGADCFTEEELFDRSVIVFGGEAFGADELPGSTSLHIPMPGKFESLNVAQALTIIVFEAVRRKVL